MLNGPMIHPELLNALGRAGHGSKILIASGEQRIYANLLLTIGVRQ